MSKVTRRDAMKRAAAAGVALAGAGAVAAQDQKGDTKEVHDVKKLEARARALQQSLKKLGEGNDMGEFLQIIHKPGWTTPAEYMLVSGLVDSMHAHATAMASLQQTLMAGSRAVAAK